MSKQLITIIGLVASLGVIALGFFLVALPLYSQAVITDAQTAAVASTNIGYQAQIDHLTDEQQNIDQVNADVAALRAQIPSTVQFDDVFEVVGRAAESAGVQLTSVTTQDQVAFSQRTSATAEASQEPAPESAPEATASPDGDTSAVAPPPSATAGRQQVQFEITAQAADMGAAAAFLDALRTGPRLVSSVSAKTTGSDAGVEIQITALAYLDTEG